MSAVLVVGDVVDDGMVLPVEPLTPSSWGSEIRASIVTSPGGSGANQAAWLGALGAPVRFAGRVAMTDVIRHTNELRRHGVDARLAADAETTTGAIVVLVGADGERDMYTDRGANLNLNPADLPDALLDDVAVLHVSGYSLFQAGPRAAVLDLVRRARTSGAVLSVDPASATYLRRVPFLDWTRGAGLIFPNLDEGRAMTGLAEAEAVADALTRHYPVVALKLGPEGTIISSEHGERYRLPAVPSRVVDTTGAGDAFCAGFLTAWIRGLDLAAAANEAVEAAALAVRQLGARPPRLGGGATAGHTGLQPIYFRERSSNDRA